MAKINKNSNYYNIFVVLCTLCITIYGVLILKFTKEISEATVNAIYRCIEIIIPSFFGFMVVSNLLVKTHVYIILSKPFSLISRYIFKIPSEYFSVFIISNIGGYPIGIKTISQMRMENKISSQDSESLICSCFCCSPSFIISVIGIGIFCNAKIGLYIYLCILISNIIIAIISGIGKPVPKVKKYNPEIKFNFSILADSIYSTSKTIFLICIMVIFFCIFNCVLECSNALPAVANFISNVLPIKLSEATATVNTIFEISNITEFEKYSFNCIPLITGLLAFGGICVFAQVITICNKQINLKKFYITRPLQIIISALISLAIFKLIPSNIAVSAGVKQVAFTHKNSIFSAICIVIMVICVIIKANNRFLNKNML